MDGRFLQGTFTATRILNDEKPDVSCAGLGGLSGLRSEDDNVNILMADGSVRAISVKVKLEIHGKRFSPTTKPTAIRFRQISDESFHS